MTDYSRLSLTICEYCDDPDFKIEKELATKHLEERKKDCQDNLEL